MAENRVFVSSELVDRWLTAGSADLDGARLRVRGTDESYLVEEAVHVTAEVTGSQAPSELVGRVRMVAELRPLGAEILDRSMVIGELAYDIVPGFLVAPLGARGGPASDVLASLAALSDAERHSDEELLARYLIEKLE